MKHIEGQTLTGERAAYGSVDTEFENCTFCDGESPLKECKNVVLKNCRFEWKYPLWYTDGADVQDCQWLLTGRSGVWYSHNVTIKNCLIDAPKQFRHSSNITLENCKLPHAEETMWACRDIKLKNVHLCGDYFGIGCENVTLEKVTIDGNYCFDGAKNIVARNCVFNSKDSFWNCQNVTLYDCVIDGEYLAWNCQNVTFVNCKLTSHQALCYVDKLSLVNCEMYQTDLCFERCTDLDVDVTTEIESIKNPYNGKICCKGYGQLVLEESIVDPSKTVIKVKND